jgi:large subunit ribosomal protein L3
MDLRIIELLGQLVWGHHQDVFYQVKKMAGQLGNKMTNIKKLKIVQVNNDENILVVKGAVPGKPGNLLSIVPSK